MSFPLFSHQISLAHIWWDLLVASGDWTIDATCGGGFDTIALAKKGCYVISFDVQKEALQKAKIQAEKSLSKEAMKRITFYQKGHEEIGKLTYENPIRLIVYNLGYFPGGDKTKTTMTETTLTSVSEALAILSPGGVISITCYPGHPEGKREQETLLSFATSLDSSTWHATHHQTLNRSGGPSLLLLQKRIINNCVP